MIDHLRARNGATAPNRNGLPKSNYYAKAAQGDSVRSMVAGNVAVVEIGHPGISLHYEGGTVRPRPGKRALAIPVDASVATIWPSEAAGIGTGGADDEPYALVWPKGSDHGWIKDTETNELLWLLVPHARIPADPTVLPSDAEILQAAGDAIQEARS